MMTARLPAYMILFNYFTPLYLVLGGLGVIYGRWSVVSLTAFVLLWLYLLLPLTCRLLVAALGRPVGVLGTDSRAFALWWFLTQLQILYNRFPVLEEMLRIVPGVYGAWLSLWGAKVSPMAYWAPGAVVTDRYLLEIGRGAVLGGGCRIGGHVMQRGLDGELVLRVAPVTIEQGAMIGLHAGVGPGCHVYANETVPAGRLLKPGFSRKDGASRAPTRE